MLNAGWFACTALDLERGLGLGCDAESGSGAWVLWQCASDKTYDPLTRSFNFEAYSVRVTGVKDSTGTSVDVALTCGNQRQHLSGGQLEHQ